MHKADEEWVVTVKGHGVVQVNCDCLCGNPECGWYASVFDNAWLNTEGHEDD